MVLPFPVRQSAPVLHLSELVGGLSHALDLAGGHPAGHALRCCWIGMQVAREADVPEAALGDVYYTLLLNGLGVSANAARIHTQFRSDDLAFQRDFDARDDGLLLHARFLFAHEGRGFGLGDRLTRFLGAVRTRDADLGDFVRTRSERGAEIARQMQFSDAVANGLASLDERWDGRGRPTGRAGSDIPIGSRIALLARIAEAFRVRGDAASALAEVRRRDGSWFDPRLVAALERAAQAPGFWELLAAPDLDASVYALAPGGAVAVDEDRLDAIALGFGRVVDAKSPYTRGHSVRVAAYSDAVARELGVSVERRRWLHRGALLHDLGKLGVSNTVLDKPDKLDPAEWEASKLHVSLSEAVLSGIGPFAELARMAGAHHERLDGTGYPRGLKADAISLETRIITATDIFDALTAMRPYRDRMSIDRTLEIMGRSVGTTLDPSCFTALERIARESVAGEGPAAGLSG